MTYFPRNKGFNFQGLRILIIAILVISVFFRFTSLDTKVYSYDETFTSLRISGHTKKEILAAVDNKEISTLGDLQKYQRISSEKDVSGTIQGLAEEEPQHPPLYFLLLRLWAQTFGTSVAAIRSLSAVIGLLIFPAIYWLSLELFESALVGWISILLVAISPFHVLYAQEAREYSLWAVTILLSSALFLRAIRKNTKLNWLMYAAGLAASLYTFPFTIFVAIGHGVYLAFVERFRLTKKTIHYLIASLLSFVSFLPWLFVMVSNLSQIEETTPWADEKVGLKTLIQGWSFAFSSVFYDTNINWQYPCNTQWWQYLPIFLLLPLMGFSIYFVLRRAPKSGIFILLLIGVTTIVLALPDVLFGGRRSLMARYLIPSYLGVELAVAYLFASQITSSLKPQKKRLWQCSLAALLSVGIISCSVSSQAENWWNKYDDPIPQAARIINGAKNPLLVGESNSVGTLVALSYRVKPESKIAVFTPSSTFKLPNQVSDIFLINPIFTLKSLKPVIERNGNTVKQIDSSWCIPMWGGLWKVEKPNNL